MVEYNRVTAGDRAEPAAGQKPAAEETDTRLPRPATLSLLAAMAGSRLCQRVALAIFLCLLAVATIFLVPAYRELERNLLTRLEQGALASSAALFRLAPADAGPERIIAAAASLLPDTPLLGGTLYAPNGDFVGSFGEPPRFAFGAGVSLPPTGLYAEDRSHYEIAWPPGRLGAPYVLVARLDSSWIGPELKAFLIRVGLVALIVAVAVTAVTMAILGLTILAPILELRQRLAAAGSDLENADRHALPVTRRDELGDVLEDFNRLLGHVARAIAELRYSHAQVRASEERWHRIFDGSADAILILDPKTLRIVDANETAARLFEYGRSELLRLDLAALEDEGAGLSRLVETAGREGRAGAEAVSCVSRGGRRILTEAQLATLPIGPSRPLLLMVRDMTERRLAEEALRLSQRRLAGILDIAQDAIISVDDTRTIRLFNKGAERIFGYAAYETIGRRLDLLLPNSQSLVEAIERRANSPSAAPAERQEVSARRRGGSEFPAELSASKFQLGEETVFTLILRDVSDRRRAELERANLLGQFHQAQKMEAIGRLAGGIAHDFNNVLAAILGYADLALYDIPPDTPAASNVQQVLKAGRRGKTLVRQILAFSRREERVERSVRLDQVLHEALDLMAATLPKTIEVERRSLATGAVIRADEAQMHQLIMNLCVNAAQAIGQEPGRIVVELEETELGPDREAEIRAAGARLVAGKLGPGAYVRLTVTDTGTGMGEETVSHMFEPFFTTKPKGEGTGLGLAAVHGIVTGRNGAIALRTAPGLGTRFEIYLPRVEDVPERAGDAAREVLAAGERILFVDDEPDLTDIGRKSLERLGFRCDTMSSASAALAEFRADPGRWQLVITDHMMPGMTGAAMAREMLALRPDLPIIICTGFGDTITAESARAAGIREFVMKPLIGRELAEIVSRLLRPRPASSNAA
jgi:PAS domain S-box-containing protein